jgi:hypothetical protein
LRNTIDAIRYQYCLYIQDMLGLDPAYALIRRSSLLTVIRVFSTLRHFAAWMQDRRSFLAGNPCAGVNEQLTDEPTWKGLSDTEIARLRSVAEKLLQLKKPGNQLLLRDKAKRLFAFQNNQCLLGYRATSELRSCALRSNPPMGASRGRQRASGRHTEWSFLCITEGA